MDGVKSSQTVLFNQTASFNLVKIEGGEIFVPKLPSVRIPDLAATIIPEAKLKITGMKSDDDLDETLITPEEMKRTLEFKHYFLIRPASTFSSYQKFKGMDYLPNMEIEQMLGRAGRPRYDTEGEGILIPKTKTEAAYAWENYIKGQPEEIKSKLGVEPVLRVHTLALIASNTCQTKQNLFDFYSKTFYSKQFLRQQKNSQIFGNPVRR